MEKELYSKVVKLLQKKSTLSFSTECYGQGGIVVDVTLNGYYVGEKYTWVAEKNHHENIPHGSTEECELANGIEEWVHSDFFEFVTSDDELLADDYDSCQFEYEDGVLGLFISGNRNWDGEEEGVSGYMVIEAQTY